MVFQKLAKKLAEHIGCEESAITRESTLESLGIDSLDVVEVVMELEDELETQLEMDQKVNTVGELVELIEAQMSK